MNGTQLGEPWFLWHAYRSGSGGGGSLQVGFDLSTLLNKSSVLNDKLETQLRDVSSLAWLRIGQNDVLELAPLAVVRVGARR